VLIVLIARLHFQKVPQDSSHSSPQAAGSVGSASVSALIRIVPPDALWPDFLDTRA